jgi:hypothetical protein
VGEEVCRVTFDISDPSVGLRKSEVEVLRRLLIPAGRTCTKRVAQERGRIWLLMNSRPPCGAAMVRNSTVSHLY